MTFPYASARSGAAARDEITKMLRRFGCGSVGFMDEFETKSLVLAFEWRGKNICLRASAEGWANAYIRENPYTARRSGSLKEYEDKWLNQGMIAVNSILRDWVKGQVTAIETGILTFDHVFMPHMLTADGTPVIEVMREQLSLPPPSPPNRMRPSP